MVEDGREQFHEVLVSWHMFIAQSTKSRHYKCWAEKKMEGSPWQPDLDWKQRDKELVDDFSWSEEDLSDRVATPFKFVSVGRGSRKRRDPQDVRLPRIFLDRIRQKNFPRRPAGRGNILKTFSSQSLSGSIQPQDSLWMSSQASPSSLSEDFLGAASRGLTSDILAGKACLMEKFLGKPMAGQGGFNPFGNKHQRSSGSLRSTQTAPLLDFSSREQWPGVGASACQSNCGKNGPKKSLSLQDALNAISRTPNQWDRASLDSSGKGSGDGSRKWRRTKRSQGRVSQGQNGSQDKEGAPRMNGSEGVAACSTVGSALPENGSKERGSENDLSGTSRQEGEVEICTYFTSYWRVVTSVVPLMVSSDRHALIMT
ncbi:uncharacterized protein LOC110980351 isoform X2 [Acanthaster planci]|uniref:Uncharacterized protein LOC110980351 isoform X2 n=1 Tax=Acanthaster planci TaxID=133434 RepID=A0A8B7YHC1_ACAPL|nr:uncharacterized protein LOC110980351 isoform X2 [Acanthaster planci]